MKKLSPNLTEEDLEALEQYSPKEVEEDQKDENEEGEIDPRWAALNKLKGKN